jgi:hypothetical protein
MAAKKKSAGKQSEKQVSGPETQASAPVAARQELPGTIFIDRNSPAWKRRIAAMYPDFKSVEERIKRFEQAQRSIYKYLPEITHENIEHARNGNTEAARLLMELAGIFELPASVEKAPKKKAPEAEAEAAIEPKAAPATKIDLNDPMTSVLSFYKKLGMTPPRLKPVQAAEVTPALIETEAKVDAAPAQ